MTAESSSELNQILRLSEVTFRGQTPEENLPPLSLSMRSGDVTLLTVTNAVLMELLGDIIEGLVVPTEGRAEFMGHCWNDISRKEACHLRRNIGRVFGRGGWLSNLNVFQNVALASRHHFNMSRSSLRARINAIAQTLEVASPQPISPEETPGIQLREAACIRACMNNPKMYILEFTFSAFQGSFLPRFVEVIKRRCVEGAVAVWILDRKDEKTADLVGAGKVALLDGQEWRWMREAG